MQWNNNSKIDYNTTRMLTALPHTHVVVQKYIMNLYGFNNHFIIKNNAYTTER